MFGIQHTRDMLVRDAHVRGMSGGASKRVSLAEILATIASIVCWDNSTRSLDASIALSFARSLRVYTDVTGKTTLVTLLKAGETIYELMEKVLAIEKGRMVFQRPAKEAKKYFEELGYWCPPRTDQRRIPQIPRRPVADKIARHFQAGREQTAPKDPEQLEHAFRDCPPHQHPLIDAEG